MGSCSDPTALLTGQRRSDPANAVAVNLSKERTGHKALWKLWLGSIAIPHPARGLQNLPLPALPNLAISDPPACLQLALKASLCPAVVRVDRIFHLPHATTPFAKTGCA